MYTLCKNKPIATFLYMMNQLPKNARIVLLVFPVVIYKTYFVRNQKYYIFFSDNCSSWNKNNAFIIYIYTIIRSSAFGSKTIIQSYSEPGHSFFLPCGRCFISVWLDRKPEQALLPSTYEKMEKWSSKSTLKNVKQYIS